MLIGALKESYYKNIKKLLDLTNKHHCDSNNISVSGVTGGCTETEQDEK